jgi:hypothetical protein
MTILGFNELTFSVFPFQQAAANFLSKRTWIDGIEPAMISVTYIPEGGQYFVPETAQIGSYGSYEAATLAPTEAPSKAPDDLRLLRGDPDDERLLKEADDSITVGFEINIASVGVELPIRIGEALASIGRESDNVNCGAECAAEGVSFTEYFRNELNATGYDVPSTLGVAMDVVGTAYQVVVEKVSASKNGFASAPTTIHIPINKDAEIISVYAEKIDDDLTDEELALIISLSILLCCCCGMLCFKRRKDSKEKEAPPTPGQTPRTSAV